MRTFNLIFRATSIALLTLVVLFGGTVRESAAAVSVGDKFSLFGDFRFRYEIDTREDAGVKSARDRARIRARFGFKYAWSENVSFGMRLRTESDNNQSPHQTLGLLGGGAGNRQDFGIDRAHIDIKFMDGGFLWLGKHGISFWEQNEGFWDGDIQPEGAGAGYKMKIGEAGSLLVQAVHTLLNENGTSDGHGIFEDDFGDTIQAVFTGAAGDLGYTGAVGALFVTEQSFGGVPGGSSIYVIISGQVKAKISQVPIKFGVDYLFSNYDIAEFGVNDVLGTPNNDNNQGVIINLASKYQKYGFKVEYYYIELNAVPAQGALAQDDFPFSSNFKGFKFQVSREIGKGFNVDLRAYPQSIIDENVTSNGLGQVQNIDRVTRYQVNLNIKF